ncbi:MAG: phosphate/phosphite/phosphonate ABC transporter substrate-binding protein [Calditrichae bacterium]|nr:phosphate/phosphite/phosphonate ABC transporter substrate-binding protein [Calditrichota bacterium]MCB9058758.1 phosphate/phosphite/phosphonate ABC transporter substrate-binding protein [Calditrichia bacterium]
MKRLSFFSILMLSFFFLLSHTNAQESFKIGVLAKRGAANCMKQWSATADYLSQKLPGKSFKIIPLDFDQVEPAVQKKEVDFVLVNSSMFITLKRKFNVAPVTTMINSRQGKAVKEFGGVILARADNGAINNLSDLKGKKFIAVEENSFGGWQMAFRELKANGIDPQKDFAKLAFAGTHDNVVLAVRNKVMDAGTVRTDTYERMAAEGKIDMKDFKIINTQSNAGFPFALSTRLYPEWPLSSLSHVNTAVAVEVTKVLSAMSADDPAAKAAKVVGWSAPLDYTSVEDCLSDLNL